MKNLVVTYIYINYYITSKDIFGNLTTQNFYLPMSHSSLFSVWARQVAAPYKALATNCMKSDFSDAFMKGERVE